MMFISLFVLLPVSMQRCYSSLSMGWLSSDCFAKFSIFFTAGLPVLFSGIVVLGFIRIWVTRHALLQSPNSVFFSMESVNQLLAPMVPAPQSVSQMARILSWGIVIGHALLSILSMVFLGHCYGGAVTGILIWMLVTLQLPSVMFLHLLFNRDPLPWFALVYALLMVSFLLQNILTAGLTYIWDAEGAFVACFVVDLFLMLYQAAWFSVVFSAKMEEAEAVPEDESTNQSVDNLEREELDVPPPSGDLH